MLMERSARGFPSVETIGLDACCELSHSSNAVNLRLLQQSCDVIAMMDRRWHFDTGYIPHVFASGSAGKWKPANVCSVPYTSDPTAGQRRMQ